MNAEHGSDVAFWRDVLDREFQEILDFLLPAATNKEHLALAAAIDYSPSHALYTLTVDATILGMVIPEPLFAQAEAVVAADGAEDWEWGTIQRYRQQHYQAA